MAKINVILEAKGRDRGARKQLRELASLADKFAESATRARAASQGLGDVAGGLPGRGGRARGAGAAATRAPGMTTAKPVRSSAGRAEREFDRAISDSVKEQRAVAKALNRQAREQEKAARNVANMTHEQLVAVELTREQNARARRAARNTARERLGPNTTRGGKGSGFSKLEFAENLAAASGEFETFASKVETGIRGSVASFSDYQKAVTEVSTLTNNIPIDEIQRITTAAAKDFGGLPTDQVKGFYAIVSAGATNAADAQEQLTYANKLAIGGVATQEEAVLAISKSVANFKDQGIGAQQAADSLFVAVQRGQTTVEEMARALPNVASAAAASGLSLDETNAALAVLSTRLPNAKEAATSLKAAFSNLQKPTKGAREEAKRLGIDFSVAGIEAAGGIEAFLLKLRSAENFDENTLAKLFDSSEARAAIANLIAGMDDYRSVLADMENKQGAADRAFAKMADTTAQKSKQIEAQWELLKIQAGESLVPAMLSVAKGGLEVVESLREWISESPHTAAMVGKLAIAVVVGSKAIAGLTSAYSMWSTLSGLVQIKTDTLTKSVVANTAKTEMSAVAATKWQKAASGMRSLAGALPGIFAGATVAITAFNLALDHASAPLTKYEETLKNIEQQQMNISFTKEATDAQKKRMATLQAELAGAERDFAASEDFSISKADARKRRDAAKAEIAKLQKEMGPREKTEAELLTERRNRLVETVNAARTFEAETKGATGGQQLRSGDIIGGFSAGTRGLFNDIVGASSEAERQRTQAEIDLARFDAQYSGQLGELGVTQAFTTEATSTGFSGDTGTLALMAEMVAATKMIAANTSPSSGPSMEAGLT